MYDFNKVQMLFSEITPNVRYVQHVQLSAKMPSLPKMIYDHRITYISGGKGTIILEDTPFPCTYGDLLFWGPAVKYEIHRIASDPLELLNIHFDFSALHKDKTFNPPQVFMDNFIPDFVTEKVNFPDNSCFNSFFHIKNYFQAETLLFKLHEEYKLQKLHYNQYINGAFLSFLATLSRHMSTKKDSRSTHRNNIDPILEFIHQHCHEVLDNKRIGNQFNFHPNYINRLMVTNTGLSLHQYVLKIKIHRALELLTNTNLPITEVSDSLGFNDTSHFYKAFKMKIGASPLEVRNTGIGK